MAKVGQEFDAPYSLTETGIARLLAEIDSATRSVISLMPDPLHAISKPWLPAARQNSSIIGRGHSLPDRPRSDSVIVVICTISACSTHVAAAHSSPP